MRPTILFLLFISCAVIIGCDDNDPVEPSPDTQFRVEAMSHGVTHYTLLKYREDGRVSEVIQGTIAEPFDSVETAFRVVYQGDLIEEITSVTDLHAFRYDYTNGKLSQSREYVDGKLSLVNDFYYDDAGHVDLWVIKQATNDELVPATRKAYRYDAAGNTIAMELETYDPVIRGHALISTSKFLDFDNKKNSASLFLNFSNPYHTLFKNNARTWRVELTNGSVGETRYAYEYNDEGYATVQRDMDGNVETKFKFVYE